MANLEYKNIKLEELNSFVGKISLYSDDFENKLGDKVKSNFKKLFSKNELSYHKSLQEKSECQLIIVDGDDFNPGKLSGLLKAYNCPIVVFISNISKIEKLKSVIMRNILIIDKNTCNIIDMSKEVETNLEAKRLRDEAKAKELGIQDLSQINSDKKFMDEEKTKENISESINFFEENIIEDKKQETNESLFFENVNVKQPEEQIEKNTAIEENKPEQKEEEINSFFVFGSSQNNKKEESLFENKNIDDEINKNEDINNDEDTTEVEEAGPLFFEEKIDYSQDIKRKNEEELRENIKNRKKATKQDNNSKYFIHNGKELKNIGIYSNDLEVLSSMKGIFGQEIEQIKILNSENMYDAIILDITFVFIKRAIAFMSEQNCPTIIVSKRGSKLKEFNEENTFNVLIIEKPILTPTETLKENFKIYLEKFDNSKPFVGRQIKDISYTQKNTEEEQRMPSMSEKAQKEPRKSSLNDVKKEINTTNKRPDKAMSLEEIYKKMGLNDIVAFNSQINKTIYITDDTKIVKYTPSGYLIEYRIKRLESKGLSKDEINDMLQKFEEIDIKFQKKLLISIDKKIKES